jgi:hypothetical protein
MRRSSAILATALCVVLTMATLGRAAANAAGPHLGVSPNPTTDRQVTAFGSDFCGAPGCSPVTIVIDDRVVASDIQVGSNGTFQTVVTTPGVAGEYVVTASQKDAEGKTISAQAPLTVMAIDQIEPTVSPPTPVPSPQGTPPAQATTPTASPPAEATATASGHPPASPTPTESGGAATATSTPSADSEAGDGGEFPWLPTAIGGTIAAALVVAAFALWRLRWR